MPGSLNCTEKGQIFSFDAVIAGAILILLFSIMFTYMWSMEEMRKEARLKMQEDAKKLADDLLSAGIPANWDSGSVTNAKKLGIARQTSNEIQYNKLQTIISYCASGGAAPCAVGECGIKICSDAEYGVLKDKFGLTYGFNVSIVKDPNAVSPVYLYSFGKSTTTPRSIVVLNRIVYMNESINPNAKIPVHLRIEIWEQ